MEDENKPVKRGRGNPLLPKASENEDKAKTKQKMEILKKLNELERRRGIAKFDNVEEMQILIENYFNDCVDLEIRPTIRGLASALGTVYTTLQGWERGERDGILGSQCSCLIKKSKQFISEYDEMLAMEGIDNPILFMFRAKNYYGMKDTQDINVIPNNTTADVIPLDELRKLADQHHVSNVVDTTATDV
jgi:hypothetical protein